jgi:5'-3' exoribonuclease 1
MGVPGLFPFLTKRYPETLVSNWNQCRHGGVADNLYIDMNGIVHNFTTQGNNGRNRIKTPNIVALELITYIDTILKIVKPTSVLYLAMDGVAPRAKRNQQRARRYRSARDAAAVATHAITEELPMVEDEVSTAS